MDIRDIAARSGYGVGTVSRVINKPAQRQRPRAQAHPRRHGRVRLRAQLQRALPQDALADPRHGVRDGRRQPPLRRHHRPPCRRPSPPPTRRWPSPTSTTTPARSTPPSTTSRPAAPRGWSSSGASRATFRESFHEIEVPCVLVTNSAADLGFDNLSSVTIDNEGRRRVRRRAPLGARPPAYRHHRREPGREQRQLAAPPRRRARPARAWGRARLRARLRALRVPGGRGLRRRATPARAHGRPHRRLRARRRHCLRRAACPHRPGAQRPGRHLARRF